MITLNVHEVKTNLSKYLERVEQGEIVIICRRNVPIAELRAVVARRKKDRPIGLAAGSFEVTNAFFDALPEEFLKAFEA